MLISGDYIKQQQILHRQDAYGSRGFNWGYLIAGIALVEGCKSILDYGSGKGTLGRTLRQAKRFDIQEYDPGTEANALPQPSDLVVSVDVLEHIEPDCLDAVLTHLRKLTRKLLFVAISIIPAKRFLTDGRNTHLIIEGGDWWRRKFEDKGFAVRRVWKTGLEEWVALMRI